MTEIECRIEPLGRLVRVRSGQSLLDAALAAGLNIPHSCKSGHCTSCRASLLAGSVFYPRGRPPGLTAAEEAAGQVLMCQARASGPVTVELQRSLRIPPPSDVQRLQCRIERLAQLAPDVMQVQLRTPSNQPLQFHAGQYLDVLLEGTDGRERRRSFSIASPPHDASLLELHVRRAPGNGFTAQVFEQLRVGNLLRIEGPLGQFVYAPGESPLLMIAGGTGMAPIKSLLRHALEAEHTARPVAFYWGVRTRADAYDTAWLDATSARFANLSCRVVLSDPHAVPEQGVATGYVHDVAAREVATLAACDVYVAGPPQLIEAVRAQYPALGVAPGRIWFDSFDYAPA